MKIKELIQCLEAYAPPVLQESYDNAGLITGSPGWECTGVLCTLDSTEEVVDEAIAKKCNLIVAHHPILFKGLKRINGSNYVEKTIIKAIKNDIAIYAIHTNLDNVANGVSGKMADKLELVNRSVLSPANSSLRKLFTFVPTSYAEQVKNSLFEAGAGHIGGYSECSFESAGTGSFKAGAGTDPFVGKQGDRHLEPESKLEVIFPYWIQDRLLDALKASHPYEEVAYDIVALTQVHTQIGAGIIGELKEPLPESEFLAKLVKVFGLKTLRHTELTGKPIKRVALCGGAGSFLIINALKAKADVYISADIKYHEFFDADGGLLLCDIGHFESEQFTIELITDILQQKFPTFAVLKSELNTNPVHYYF